MSYKKNPKLNMKSGDGILHKMGKIIDNHSNFIDNIKVGKGLVITSTAEGSILIDCNNVDGINRENDYAFRTIAKRTTDPDKLEFDVRITNGFAQVFGSTAWMFLSTGGTHWFSDNPVADGTVFAIQYSAYNPTTLEEICQWKFVTFPSLSTFQQETSASIPAVLHFPFAQVKNEYTWHVNQMHKGSIIIPAISNVVDIENSPVQLQASGGGGS